MMKFKLKVSDWCVFFLVLVVVTGFFLPWVKGGGSVGDLASGVARKIGKELGLDREYSWYDFFRIRNHEWRAAVRAPLDGVAGWQFPSRVYSRSARGREAAEFVKFLFGQGAVEQKSLLVYLFPAVALAAGISVILVKKRRRLFLVPVGACLLLYFLARWRLLATDFPRSLGQIHAGLGFWLTLFGLLFLGLVLVAKIFLPAKGKI